MPIVSVAPEYVLGFYFLGSTGVVLINKLKPAFQFGKLNGVGGRIEPGESSHDAMVREFKEETGKLVPSWIPFARMEFRDCTVYCFHATGDAHGIGFGRYHSPTEETVVAVDADVLPRKVLPNLRWLIPMARTGETNLVIRCD